jgi:hypothetical protein
VQNYLRTNARYRLRRKWERGYSRDERLGWTAARVLREGEGGEGGIELWVEGLRGRAGRRREEIC